MDTLGGQKAEVDEGRKRRGGKRKDEKGERKGTVEKEEKREKERKERREIGGRNEYVRR